MRREPGVEWHIIMIKYRILPWLTICILLILAVAAWRIESPAGDRARLETLIICPPGEVSALALSGDTVWAGGQEGVYRIDRRTGIVQEKLDAGLPLDYVQSLLVDGEGVLWIAHINGLTRYDGHDFLTYDESNGLPDRRVNSLLLDTKGRLWAGTWGGAACFDGNEWNVLTKEDGLAEDMVNAMLEDSGGGMWFGSYVAPRGGLSYYNGLKWFTFTAPDPLPHNGICDLMEDQQGRIWIATGFLNQGGAVYCELDEGTPGNWVSLSSDDILAGPKVRSLFQDRSGVYWLASEYDGVARWDGQSRQIITRNDGLSGMEVKDWLQDEDGVLWLGTNSGLTVIKPASLGLWLAEIENSGD